MGNALDENIEGRVVVISTEYLAPGQFGVSGRTALEKRPDLRCFEVTGGFGAHPHTIGGAIFGPFLYDGERVRLEGFMVERLATGEEIAKVKSLRADAAVLQTSLVGDE